MLTIHSFQSNYLVSQEHPSPEKLRARLDDILRGRLSSAIDGLLQEWERHQPGLWFIRDLDIELEINAAWDDDLVAGLWAEKIILRLSRNTSEEEPGSLYFPDQAAYLARFLIDLAAGRAWGVWYYQSFEGLRSLTVAAAVRTVLENDPELGLAALTRLEQNELEDVLAAVGNVDARRLQAVYSILSESDFAFQKAQELFELGWQAWSQPKRSLGEPAEALFHFVQATRRGTEHPHRANLIWIAQALTRLSWLVNHLDDQETSRLLSALSGGDLATLYATAGQVDGEVLRFLLHAEPAWLWQVGRALRQTLPDSDPLGTGQPLPTAIRHTPFGGAFLLLPQLALLHLDEATQGWPRLEKAPAGNLLRFLALTVSFGQGGALQAFNDPLLRNLLLIPPEISARQAAAWMKSITPAQRKNFYRHLADWHDERGFDRDRLLAAHRQGRDSQLALVSVSQGIWRTIADPSQVGGYLDSGQVIVSEEKKLRETLRAKNPGLQVITPDDVVFHENEISPAELRARLAQFPKDARDLSLPSDLYGSSASNALISLLAQNILCLFAGRLPGFSRSGPGYLFHNFLDFAASLQDEPDRRIVMLGKPPLSLIIRMSGQNRQSYRLGWLDERPFELYQQD